MFAGFLAFWFAGLDPVVPLGFEVEVVTAKGDERAAYSAWVTLEEHLHSHRFLALSNLASLLRSDTPT